MQRQHVGLDQRSYSTLGPVSAWVVTVFGRVSHLSAEQNQAPRPTEPEPAVIMIVRNEYPAKAGRVNRHIAWYTSQYPWSRSLVLVPGWTDWLAEISADLAHQRRVCDDALYKSTVTYLLFLTSWSCLKLTVPVCKLWICHAQYNFDLPSVKIKLLVDGKIWTKRTQGLN